MLNFMNALKTSDYFAEEASNNQLSESCEIIPSKQELQTIPL